MTLKLCARAGEQTIGAQRMFAAHIVFGAFPFARVMSPITPLARGDAGYAWRERLPGAFYGYARQAPGHAV